MDVFFIFMLGVCVGLAIAYIAIQWESDDAA